MLIILRVVGVVTVGPLGRVFQITQHVLITDTPTSITYRHPTILSVVSVTKKLLWYVLNTENNKSIVLILCNGILLGRNV